MAWMTRSGAARRSRDDADLDGDAPKILAISAAVIGAGLVVRRLMSKTAPPADGPFAYQPSLPARLFANLSVWVDHRIGWPKLPMPLGLILLIGERIKLRAENLHDTSTLPSLPQAPPTLSGPLTNRSRDGTFNDLAYPAMGERRHPVRAQRPERGGLIRTRCRS